MPRIPKKVPKDQNIKEAWGRAIVAALAELSIEAQGIQLVSM